MIVNREKRSVLISDENTNQRIDPIDDNFYKRKSVFERLGGSSTSVLNTNKDALKENAHISNQYAKKHHILIQLRSDKVRRGPYLLL